MINLNYRYKAVDFSGRKICGVCEAQSEEELWNEMRSKRIYLINYRKTILRKEWNLFVRVSKKDIAAFCNKFSMALEAGITLERTLYLLEEQSTNCKIKKSLINVRKEILKGESLYKSMKKFHYVFPEFLLEMINIGEQSGKMDEILNNLYIYYEKEYKHNKKLINSMIYPAVVFCTSIIVCIFLLTNVVPIFIGNLESVQGDMPRITKVVLGISEFLIYNKYKLLGGIPLILVLLKYSLNTKKGITFKSHLKLKIPIIKELFKCYNTSKICKSMNLLLQSGVNIIKALEITYDIINNKAIKDRFQSCINEIKKGNSLCIAFRNAEIFDSFVISMISVGEETGNLDKIFLKMSEIYDNLIEDKTTKLLTLLEPLMIVILGIFVGVIILAAMLPVLNFMESI